MEKLMKFHSSKYFIFVWIAFVCVLFAATSAYAQVDLGGKSMMGDLPFIKNFASTAQDIALLAAKVAGAILATIGIFQIAKRNWDYAIPALLGGSGLFFMPQIIAALQKLGGGG